MWNRPVIKSFMIPVADDSVGHVALGFNPQFIVVRTDPSLSIPSEGLFSVGESAFQLGEADVLENGVVVDRGRPVRRNAFGGIKRGFRSSLSVRRRGSRQSQQGHQIQAAAPLS